MTATANNDALAKANEKQLEKLVEKDEKVSKKFDQTNCYISAVGDGSDVPEGYEKDPSDGKWRLPL